MWELELGTLGLGAREGVGTQARQLPNTTSISRRRLQELREREDFLGHMGKTMVKPLSLANGEPQHGAKSLALTSLIATHKSKI